MGEILDHIWCSGLRQNEQFFASKGKMLPQPELLILALIFGDVLLKTFFLVVIQLGVIDHHIFAV